MTVPYTPFILRISFSFSFVVLQGTNPHFLYESLHFVGSQTRGQWTFFFLVSHISNEDEHKQATLHFSGRNCCGFDDPHTQCHLLPVRVDRR